jgi:hypothetical protein
MGKLLILQKYIFLVYGSDILEKRRHVHVTFAHRGYKRACKFWLEPPARMTWSDGDIALDPSKPGDFSEKELNEIKKLVVEHKTILLKQLDLFYDHIPVKAIRK